MGTPASHLWRPSTARYVQVDGFVPTPRGPQIPPTAVLAWPAKDPGDTLDYVFDIMPALAANAGDGISTLDVVISSAQAGDLTLAASSVDGTRAVLWLTGGQANIVYAVTLTIGTAGGRSLVRTVSLPVSQLSVTVAPVNALTTPGGTALTGPSGAPLTLN